VLSLLRGGLEQLRWTWKHIPRGALVLEVGSGDKPLLRSDLLCDKHWVDDTERGGALIHDRPLVIGDLGALPFRDAAVDFVVCHHVLEHVEQPARCLDELMRVARRGSIRVPSALAEKLLSPVYHRWLIDLEEGVLVFRPKPAPILDLEVKAFMKDKVLKGRRYRRFYRRYRRDLELQVLWEDRIGYRITDGEGGGPNSHFRSAVVDQTEGPRSVNRPSLGSPFSRLLRWFLRAPPVDLESLLACPACRRQLKSSCAGLECSGCRLAFPVRGGVPIVLLEQARPLGPRGAAAEA
jgi:uncharacterized protein YbaR (Trm112 family)